MKTSLPGCVAIPKFTWRIVLALVALLTAGGASESSGRIPAPEYVPLERLLKNAEACVAKRPSDPKAHYVLGRIHHLAFLRGCEAFPESPGSILISYGPDLKCADDPLIWRSPEIGMGRVALAEQRALKATGLEERRQRAIKKLGTESVELVDPVEIERLHRSELKQLRELELEEWIPNATLSWKARFDHGESALNCFRTAMRLDPSGSLYPLAIASFAEDLDRTASRVKDLKLPETLQRLGAKEIRSLFRRAFELATPPDNDWRKWSLTEFAMGQPPQHGENFTVFVDAGESYVRNATRTSARLSPSEKRFLREVKSGLAKRKEFDTQNPGVISPIIFSFNSVGGIQELLDPQMSVAFDLDGYGGDHLWPWVKPTTGFLVWDPGHTGRVASGRQMFGTYTFGIPWENGYRALASLDDNGDGVLTDEELRGLAVWFESGGDPLAKAGTVIPVEDLGIVAVAVRETGCEGIHPTNPDGITLKSGQRLRTWDWFASPRR